MKSWKSLAIKKTKERQELLETHSDRKYLFWWNKTFPSVRFKVSLQTLFIILFLKSTNYFIAQLRKKGVDISTQQRVKNSQKFLSEVVTDNFPKTFLNIFFFSVVVRNIVVRSKLFRVAENAQRKRKSF